MHRGHDVHDTTIPDFADHPCGDVGDQVRRGRFDADLGDEDGSGLFGGRLMLEDDLLDPGSLAGDVKVMCARLCGGLNDGRRVQVKWTNGVEDDSCLLGKSGQLRGAEVGDGDDVGR